jgi:1-acyl-sn-glycerol-3-phosphate acyltransferase
MIYIVMRQFVRFVLRFYIKQVEVNGLDNLPTQGPIILAGFHPNSFLDALVINCTVNRPIWSLARGDAFKKSFARAILSKFYMMPIYRISEGKEYLGKNDETFERCYEIFDKGGQVLIFSEGVCKNQTELLPLKKGTARLAFQTWQTEIDLKIVPVAVNYEKYNKIGKNIVLNFGPAISKTDFESFEIDGGNIKTFNEKLTQELTPLITRTFKPVKAINTIIFEIIYFLHFPVYKLLGGFVEKKTKRTVFFDSIFTGLLIVALPIYWLLLFGVFKLVF